MNKHFLDSSVVQPMLLGSKEYQTYFAGQFADNPIYISKYVQMEVKRSCLAPMIEFYFVLNMPSVKTIGDALNIWSNRFSGREIKAVTRLMAQMIDTYRLQQLDPKDKPNALRHFGVIIKRIEAALRRKFADIGTNSTRCARAQVDLIASNIEELSLTEQLEQFINQFNDTDACRHRCRVDDFLLNRYHLEVSAYIQQAQGLSKPKSQENKGFVQVTENLAKIVQGGASICSCRMCGQIGDAIIALETPRNMQLEHTDFSFDQLCVPIKQPHRRHSSEVEVHKAAGYHSSSSPKVNE